MRNLTPVLLLLLVLAGSAAASAQTLPDPSGPSDIAVLKSKWDLNVRNPQLDEDPFRANDEQREFEKVQKEAERLNRQGQRQAGVDAKYPVRKRIYRDLPSGPQVTFIYTVKVQNTGSKIVQAIVWTYAFSDPSTQKEVGRHQHTSKVKIKPGKTEELVGRSASPPIQIIDARKANGALPDQIDERVLIEQIEYTDGSVWQRPSK
ncbi:MAG TPA: hypothetical protein VM095_01515 [Pyrinomonadaceae bacterium]|nr:hypothetical protein [Pyrinomonadaceae bacterium]